jgi:carotenoid cleavage dioxygenase-like enzyme
MHPWFRTLTDEVRDRRLDVDGTVPAWLDGALVRNGPAHFESDGGQVNHWFDGLAMLRRFGFADGDVRYTNRFLRSNAYRSRVGGRVAATEFGTGPTSLPRRLSALVLPTATDNANVTVAELGGRTVALTETPRMVAFDPETLVTFGSRRFDDDVPGQWTAAHVEHDRDRGETVGFTLRFGPRSSYHVYRLDDGRDEREELARIPADRPAYVHSAGVTDRHVVLPEIPYTTTPRRLLSPSVEAFVDAFEWDDSRQTRFHLVDRDDGSVSTVEGPPFFFFHTVNAFERGSSGEDETVVDLIAFPDAAVVDALSFDRVERGVREATGDLRRFVLSEADGSGGDVVTSRTVAENVALPRTAPTVRRRPYRYAYAQRTGRDDATGVVKVDVEEGTEQVWHEPERFAGEPVFVPRTGVEDGSGGGRDGDRDEDDGVVLSVVLDAHRERSFLLVLDGESFEERARAWLPHALPLGFHGEYVD